MNEKNARLNFLEKFISKYYPKQPPLIRSFTFLIFVILLVYSIFRITGGEYSVRGRILINVDSVTIKPAKNYDVQIGDKIFGTNSRGQFYLVLGPSQYYKLLFKGKIVLHINKGDIFFPADTVMYSRFGQELADIGLILDQVQSNHLDMGEMLNYEKDERGFISSILFTYAFAGFQGTKYNRLYITAIQPGPKFPSIKNGTLKLWIGNNSFTLLTQTWGSKAGPIPIVVKKKISFDTDYYFKLPTAIDPNDKIHIKLSAENQGFLNFFSSYSEEFSILTLPQYGNNLIINGNMGTNIEILLMSHYDFVLWDKDDLHAVKPRLIKALEEEGLRVVEKKSYLGYYAQTNALFGGKQVPFTIMQKILEIIRNQNIIIKSIHYQRDLKSGNPYEIQLGGGTRYNNDPPISSSKIDSLINASTEIVFKNVLKNIKK